MNFKFIVLFSFNLVLFSFNLYAEDMTLPSRVIDRRTQNNFEYLQRWAKKNVVGSNAEFFWVERAQAVQVISGAGAFNKILFDIDVEDANNIFDETTNNRMVPRVKGLYHLTAVGNLTGITDLDTVIIEIRKNGNIARGSVLRGNVEKTGITGEVAVHVCGYMRLLNSDYVEVYISQNSGANQNLSDTAGRTYFQGYLVRTQ